MRTTIEIRDDHRAKLLALAARRKRKGFSDIVTAAIEAYLKSAERSDAERQQVRELRGSLSTAEAEQLRAETSNVRRTWR